MYHCVMIISEESDAGMPCSNSSWGCLLSYKYPWTGIKPFITPPSLLLLEINSRADCALYLQALVVPLHTWAHNMFSYTHTHTLCSVTHTQCQHVLTCSQYKLRIFLKFYTHWHLSFQCVCFYILHTKIFVGKWFHFAYRKEIVIYIKCIF